MPSPAIAPLDHTDLCHPMARRAPFTANGWLFELKHDGFRAFARSGTRVQLLSRWGRSMTTSFPEIVAALRALPDAVLDGELVVPDDEGRSDFGELRLRALLQHPRRIERSAVATPAVFVVFDLLELEGDNVRELPLFERRRLLHRHVNRAPGIQIVQHVETHGEALFAAIVGHDHEGIVAKRADAPYRAGKRPEWAKIKNRNYSRREAVEWHDRFMPPR